jgi:hypothetical protein
VIQTEPIATVGCTVGNIDGRGVGIRVG